MNERKDLESKLVALQERLGESSPGRMWRSLDELLDSPAFQELVRQEFPVHADTWPEAYSRRKFLALMGASLALAGLSGCSVKPAPQVDLVPYTHPPEVLTPGEPLFFATAMTHAGSAVGLLVESHMGRPTKVEGNPQHPASRGATNVFHQASVLTLYDPDRAKTPVYLGQTRTWGEAAAAIGQAMTRQKATRGAGFRLLTPGVVSPTLVAQIENFRKAFPQARWHCWEPIHDDAAWHAAQLAFGEPATPIYDFSRADVVLSLAADFFPPLGNLRYAADFMDRRRVRTSAHDAAQAEMNRLYMVETTVSVTGAKADHRLAVRAQDVERIARAVATRLGIEARADAATGGDLDQRQQRWVDAVADDLQRHRARSLILPGRGQPPVVHLLAHALNERLGDVGQTVAYIDPIAAPPGDRTQSLRELTQDMAAGKVEFLLILDGNPAYDAPADVPFAEMLSRLAANTNALVMHHGLFHNETTYRCQWQLPATHYLESWSDGRAYEGSVSLVQPLIEPLYQGRSEHEVMHLVATQQETSGREIVRGYWQEQWQGRKLPGAFADFWETCLHDGVIRWPAPGASLHGNGAQPKTVKLQADWQKHLATTPLPLGAEETLEIVFQADPSVYDGAFAENAWLQELPHPISKLTWGNAAIVSPATAERLGLKLESYLHGGEHGGYNVPVVELQLNGRIVSAPVWIMPGHADNSVTVHLGYGRRGGARLERSAKTGNWFRFAGAADSSGAAWDGLGFNAYRLRTADHPGFASGLLLLRTNRHEPLACTQGHHTMADREVVHTATLAEYHADPQFPQTRQRERQAGQTSHAQPPLTLYKEFDYSPPLHKWGMLIDLTTCIGCNACIVACQAENNIPVVGKEQVTAGREMHWLRVDRYISGSWTAPAAFHFQPVPCMHCEQAPCEYVCPVEATVHSAEGLNDMVYQRCVGTRFCSNNCPYKVRRFNFFHYAEYDNPQRRLQYNPEVTVRSRGVMEKCSYCVQRIRRAEIETQKQERPLRDGEVLTACQAACPTQAITFGNLNDPTSLVKRWKEAPLHYALLADLNTRPRTTYLAELRNPNAELQEDAHGRS